MKQFLRFSVSGLLGFLITAALFVGMLSLLKGNSNQVKSQDTDIRFSFVKEFKEAAVKPPKKHEKPEQQAISQPPTMPAVAIESIVSPEVTVPDNATQGKNQLVLTEMTLPGIGGPLGRQADNPGAIKAAIAPMYPQAALISKTEGWVEVKIDVNEFGMVSAVTVVDAKPARVFNSAAIKAVRKWKFHPKTIDGKAIPFQAIQTIEFKIDQ